MMMLPMVAFVGCSKDDDEGGKNGSNSGWVEIGKQKYSTKYSYLTYYDGADEYGVMCTDTDLSDYLKGKKFNKTFSMIAFEYTDYTLDAVYGFYDCKVDTSTQITVAASDKSLMFEWESDFSDHNPAGSVCNADQSGNTFTFEGEGLLADVWLEDADGHEVIDYGLQHLAFSLKAKPTNIDFDDTRSTQVEVITDKEEAKRLRALIKTMK